MNSYRLFVSQVVGFLMFYFNGVILYEDIKESNKKYFETPGRRTVYEIEVLMVADYSVYAFWRSRVQGYTTEERDANAKQNLTQFYALMFDAIDLRYSSMSGRGYEMKILFAGLYIADTAAGAPWIEMIKSKVGKNHFTVDAIDAVINFQNWTVENKETLPEHDYAIAFTSYELTSPNYRSTAGAGYTGGLCSNHKVSVVVDKFHANTATYAARQIAFSFNAKRDGYKNNCSSEAGYVMDRLTGVSSDATTNQRLWKFSSCTQDYLDTFITELNCENMNCLITRSASFNASILNEYTTDLLGQIYPPDEQCKGSDGPASYMNRQMLDFDYSSICAKMGCSFPENNGSYWYRIPWEGTSCGNGKMCIKGACVTHKSAPYGIKETCLFGDRPGRLYYNNQTCSEIIIKEAQHYKCYDYKFAADCCQSCGTVAEQYSRLIGCKYGDRISNCDASRCQFYTDYIRTNSCCSACGVITTHTTVNPKTSSTVSYDQETTCTNQAKYTDVTTSNSENFPTTFGIPKIHECPWTRRSESTTNHEAFNSATSTGDKRGTTTVSGTESIRAGIFMTQTQRNFVNRRTNQVTKVRLLTNIVNTYETETSSTEAKTPHHLTLEISGKHQSTTLTTNTSLMRTNNYIPESQLSSRYQNSTETEGVTTHSKTFRTVRSTSKLNHSDSTTTLLSELQYTRSDTKQPAVMGSFDKVFTRRRNRSKCSAAATCFCAATVWLIALLIVLLDL